MSRETITPDGLKRLEAELEELTTTRRREVAERIREAREYAGDLTDNAEYDVAKNEQAMLEARIAALREHLESATVVTSDRRSTDAVQVGSAVRVKDQDSGKSERYLIVGSAEASPAEHKLSDKSPVGQALIGHRRNEIVTVQLPHGRTRKLKITKIDAA